MSDSPVPGDSWRPDEITILLDAYFDLMMAERAGIERIKADLNRQLQAALPARSRGSIEYKLQNVSAALDDIGVPWIDGYRPARNYQSVLRTSASDWLKAHSTVAEALAAYGDETPIAPKPRTLASVLVPAPAASGKHRGTSLHLSRGDWGALKDARNRALGSAGEARVVEVERAELTAQGRVDLAEGVDWVSRTRGDGLGYDVMSFRTDGTEKLIEVKTTNLGPRSPFYLTRREVAVSRSEANRYHLYRVFDFARDPRLFVIDGSLGDQLLLEPLLFHARP